MKLNIIIKRELHHARELNLRRVKRAM